MWTLTWFGEEMIGLIHLHQHGLKMLAARQAADGTDADLIQAARFESERLQLSVTDQGRRGSARPLGRGHAGNAGTLIEEQGVSACALDTDIASVVMPRPLPS